MSLAIISNTIYKTNELTSILQHYFPCEKSKENNNNLLRVQNKYYTCDVPIVSIDHLLRPQQTLIMSQNCTTEQDKSEQIISPQNSQPLNKAQPLNKSLDKTDLLIFLFDQEQIFQGLVLKQLIDSIIQKLAPQSFIACVSLNSPSHLNQKSKNEAQWIYQQQVQQCQNFIPVVYSNLSYVLKQRPIWQQGGLLAQEETGNDGIFQIFDLIQNTIWTNAHNKTQIAHGQQTVQKIKQLGSNQTVSSKKMQNAQNVQELQNVQKVQKVQKQEQVANNGDCDEFDQNYDQQKLQRQMQQFESLMHQMMTINTNQAGSNNQRKSKAENLILKLTKNLNI